jgi:hypothetical protein
MPELARCSARPKKGEFVLRRELAAESLFEGKQNFAAKCSYILWSGAVKNGQIV